MMAVQARNPAFAGPAQIIQRLPLRDLILNGQRKIDEAVKIARPMLRTRTGLEMEVNLSRMVGGKIDPMAANVEGIFASMPDGNDWASRKKRLQSHTALHIANNNIMKESKEILRKNESAFLQQAEIYKRYGCYALL